MKQVQSIVGRLVQRVAGKGRKVSAAGAAQRPIELDARSLKQVAGGDGATQTPNKGW